MVAVASIRMVLMLVLAAAAVSMVSSWSPNYGDALSKSLLFFEGQRSGKLPPNQRLTWRKDSALFDGHDNGVDLVGGYYDAGDNIKFHFPMAFSTTLLAWSVLEFGNNMGSEFSHALEAIRWSTDYLLKATNVPGVVYAQVGNPFADHNCWERPEDMDTSRTSYAVTTNSPGSEVSAEIAAALAASSMVFQTIDPEYSQWLIKRATSVFDFADKYRGSYKDSRIGQWVCPFYCDSDELIWGAAWLHKATNSEYYWNYVLQSIQNIENPYYGGGFADFNWDQKHGGITILVSKFILDNKLDGGPFLSWADKFMCSLLPGSPSPSVTYTPGGLIFKKGMCNMQNPTALSFLTLVYATYTSNSNRVIQCENGVADPSKLIDLARDQVDYILGKNPMGMSYMVGYGKKFPQQVHHRGSSLPSLDSYRKQIKCKEGTPYFQSKGPNPNLLIGAVVGGPDQYDRFIDDRVDAAHLEPTTYVNAPLVGVLAYFKAH